VAALMAAVANVKVDGAHLVKAALMVSASHRSRNVVMV
jgi:hypothetical protein